MDQKILDYIKSQKVGVLAVEMMDGSPHAATVHFANTENPLILLFETYRESRKAEPLFAKKLTRASVVIGSNESDMKTLQLDGEVRLLDEQEKIDLFQKIYLDKFSEKIEKSLEPKVVPFMFIPKWWRYTDWTKPEGKLILSSEDKN
jgi:general stress protein 26